MAKKKGARKAARGSGSQTAARVRRAVGEATARAPGGNAVANDRLVLGADLTRLMTQLLAEVQHLRSSDNTLSSRLGSIESAVQGMQERLPSLQGSGATAGTRPENASDTTITPSPLPNLLREGIVIGWRQSLWFGELNQSKPLPRPRSTFLGRALSDIGATHADGATFTIVGLFQHIQQQGPHHLDQNACGHLASIVGGDNAGRKLASSGLSKLFKKRFEQLQGSQLADEEADRRWLSPLGRDIFRNWPDWQVEHDDAACQGEARLARPRAASPDTVAADLGSRDSSQ